MFFNVYGYSVGANGSFQYPSYVNPANGDMSGMWVMIAICLLFLLLSSHLQFKYLLQSLTLYGGPKDASATTEESSRAC